MSSQNIIKIKNNFINVSQFQQEVFNFLLDYLTKETLLKISEIKKFFPPSNFHSSSLCFWFAKISNYSKNEIIVFSALLEIIQQAMYFHQKIKEDELSIEDKAKNIKKILLGDILIALSLNLINSFSQKHFKVFFYQFVKDFFFLKINASINKTNMKKNTPSKSLFLNFPTTANWLSYISYFYAHGNSQKNIINKFVNRIIDFLTIKKKVFEMTKLSLEISPNLYKQVENSLQKLKKIANQVEEDTPLPAKKIITYLQEKSKADNKDISIYCFLII